MSIDIAKIKTPETGEDFARITGEIRSAADFQEPKLWALGGKVYTGGLEPILASARFPVVNGTGQNLGSLAVLHAALGLDHFTGEAIVNITPTVEQLEQALRLFTPFEGDGKIHHNIIAIKAAIVAAQEERPITFTAIHDESSKPMTVEDATLRLYGISLRHFKPRTICLDGAFGILPNVVWVGDMPMDAGEVDEALLESAFGEDCHFFSDLADKFPLLLNRVNPLKLGIRVTDARKMRLGFYAGKGVTYMPGASYGNFNSGAEGPNMIEGRLSSQSWIGAGTDIGGGASLLGTLSGGNATPISMGRNCLLEVNSVLGIPVGDAVIVAAGDRVLASSSIQVNLDGHHQNGKFVKGSELIGISGVTFRRNDRTGVMEVVRTQRNIDFAHKLENGETILNAILHSTN